MLVNVLSMQPYVKVIHAAEHCDILNFVTHQCKLL